jgi:hypothetical protein
MSKGSSSSESASESSSGSELESPLKKYFVYVKGKDTDIAIPTLNLNNIREQHLPQAVALPTIEEQFATQEQRFLSLKQKAEAAENNSEKITSFALNAIEFASSTLGLMQAITGNEHDSHAEKIRKSRIPYAIRNEIMRDTKELQTQFTTLSSSFHNSLTESTDSISPYILHSNYAKMFLDLGSTFYEDAKKMQKKVDDALLAKQQSRNYSTRDAGDVDCTLL